MPNRPTPGLITAIATQAKIRRHLGERVNIFIDGQFALAVDAALIEKHQLCRGKYLSEDDITRLLQEDGQAKAFARALHFLSYRPRSTGEVRERLLREGWNEDTIRLILERLQNDGYLNDAVFAGLWVEHRTLGKPRGSNALQQELRKKGVTREIIDQSLPNLSQEQENAAIAARSILNSKNRLWAKLEEKEKQTKLIQTMQRRGFSFSVARWAYQQILDETENDTS